MYDSKECLSPPVTSGFDHLYMDSDIVKLGHAKWNAVDALADFIHSMPDPLARALREPPIVDRIRNADIALQVAKMGRQMDYIRAMRSPTAYANSFPAARRS